MKALGNDNHKSGFRSKSAAGARAAFAAAVACCAAQAVYAQDAPPSVYFPTTQEENVVNPELRHWSPPRNLWPEQPTDTIDPSLIEDPQRRVETRYTSDPDVKHKPEELSGVYTDVEEEAMQQSDFQDDRPSELWPSQEVETSGSTASSTVEYSEKVQYTATGGAAGGYAQPIPVTPHRGDTQPTTYYLTESEEELFQRDTIGETGEALWAEELWSPNRINSPYDAAAPFFTPVDSVLRTLTWGPALDRNYSRARYWNPHRYDGTFYSENRGQFNRYYSSVNANRGFFEDRGLKASFGDTYGDRNRFTYEADVGVGANLAPFAFRRYIADPVFRVGPLSLENMSLSASLLYTNYDGPAVPEGVDADGFIAIIELSGNLLLQITENFYLTASGSVYYLPFENEVGFGLSNGLGTGLEFGPLTFTRLAYEWEMFNWDWMIYDEFSVSYSEGSGGFNWYYNNVNRDGGVDRVGRYSFGDETRSLNFDESESNADLALNLDNFIFRNAVGILGTGDISKDLRGITALTRNDYWDRRSRGGVDEHFSYTSFRLRMDYNSYGSRWHGYGEYTIGGENEFDTFYQTATIGAFADITENITIDGNVGYFWTDHYKDGDGGNRNRWLYELGIYHRISQYLNHSLRGGSVYERDVFRGESYVADYIQYLINWKAGPFTDVQAFARFANVENVTFGLDDRSSFTTGVSVYQQLDDHTDGRATLRYYTNDYDVSDRGKAEGLVAEAMLDTNFRPDWYFRLLYRFTDQEGGAASETFEEHLALATLTRRF